MAKKQTSPDPSSSRVALAVMALAGVLVAALVIWALTRTVESPVRTATFEPLPGVETPAVDTRANEPATATAPPAAGETPSAVAIPDTPPVTRTMPLPPPVPGREAEASVPRIAAEDLRAKIQRNEVVVVDVRDARSYQNGHIPGAIHAPFANIEASMGVLPKDKLIVTYCT